MHSSEKKCGHVAVHCYILLEFPGDKQHVTRGALGIRIGLLLAPNFGISDLSYIVILIIIDREIPNSSYLRLVPVQTFAVMKALLRVVYP